MILSSIIYLLYLSKPIYTESAIYCIPFPLPLIYRFPFLKMYSKIVTPNGDGLTPKVIDKILDDKIQEATETFLSIQQNYCRCSSAEPIREITPEKRPTQLFEDIELFYTNMQEEPESSQTTVAAVQDKRKQNGGLNDRRENILVFIANRRELPEEYGEDPRWKHLHVELHKILSPYYDATTTTGWNCRFVKKAGRAYNYDFEFTCGSTVVKYEFKYCATPPRIDALPQIYQGTTSATNIFDNGFTTFDEYYYENGLLKYCEIDSPSCNPVVRNVSSIIDKATYLKHVKSANSTHPFFRDLKSRVATNTDKKNAVVNECIENYLTQCQPHVNINAVSKLLEKQKDKTYLMWHPKTRQFYTEQIPEHELTITRVANITKNTIVFMAATYSYCFLLRWKNGKGILNPAWQISLKKIN